MIFFEMMNKVEQHLKHDENADYTLTPNEDGSLEINLYCPTCESSENK